MSFFISPPIRIGPTLPSRAMAWFPDEYLTHFGSDIPTLGPLFFFTTKTCAMANAALAGPGKAPSAITGGYASGGPFGGHPAGVSRPRGLCSGSQSGHPRWSFLWNSRAHMRAIGDGRSGLLRWNPDHGQVPPTPRRTVQPDLGVLEAPGTVREFPRPPLVP